MNIPLYSTVTLIAELFVSTIIYYSIYQGYKHNKFPTKLAAGALLYELLFNITYMVSRVGADEKAMKVVSSLVVGLAIIHGILSLLMFIALIIFFVVAWTKYRKGANYFYNHKILTYVFLFFWTFSILSGILFYFLEYIF